MSYLLLGIIIGVLSTAAMSTFLWIVTALKLANADMIKAIGSFYTENEDTAFVPGAFMHFTGGIFFCFIYLLIFNIIPVPGGDPRVFIILGTGMGLVHGVVVSLLLAIAVAGQHPLEKYRKVGFQVAVYHFLGHLIYGLCIGCFYTLFLLERAAL